MFTHFPAQYVGYIDIAKVGSIHNLAPTLRLKGIDHGH
jgi:hypothetical protein